MSYLPQIAWSTLVNDVVLLSPTTYRVTISPLDINEPGATVASVAIGYYLEDYVGYKYTIIAINVGGNPNNITVNDDFGVGFGPQSGQIAYIYKSVGDGKAPYIAPIPYSRLDETALDYSRAIELDILWKATKDTVQVLSGLTPSWDVLKGIHATLTLSGDTTITLSNLVAGQSGNLTITNPSTVYTLTFSGYTNELSPAIWKADNQPIVSGLLLKDCFSWYYDGILLLWNGTNGYKP